MKHGLCLVLVLLMGCASLTPDRVSVLAAIAGQAAYLGAQDWLRAHPNHRPAFDAVILAISALVKAGNTNQDAYVELLSSLPTMTLRGKAGELYISDALVVYDNDLGRATRISGAAEQPVERAILLGLKQALAPMPPMPNSRHTNQVPPSLWVLPEAIGESKTDAELDAEFEAIKAKLGKPK